VIQELKRTDYRPASVTLGSREHFCIYTSVSRATGARQNAMCKRAREEDRCRFYTSFRKGFGKKVNTDLMDIEEIVVSCKESGICPFYKSREDAKEAELLLLPYDYLINPQTRESLQISLKNNILIFDEGHNIEKSCEEIASFELDSSHISNAISEINDAFDVLSQEQVSCEEALEGMPPQQFLIHLNILKKNLLALEESIDSENLEWDPTTERKMSKAPGRHILDIFGRGGRSGGDAIKAKDAKRIGNITRLTIKVLTFSMDTTGSGGLYLDKFQSLLAVMFTPDPTELDKNYQVLVYEQAPTDAKKGTKRKSVDFFSDLPPSSSRTAAPRTLCLWCFSCSVALHRLEQHEIRSMIITSGTLSPLDGTIEAFGIPFPVVLENSHVINTREQLWGGVLTAGPENVSLEASFAQRGNPAYMQELGRTVLGFAGAVPDGLLLAFYSYAQKEAVLREWRQSGILEQIVQRKPIFEEPRSNAEMKIMMEKYNEALRRTPAPGGPVGGAMLAAVCRGRLCEGIDFTDRQCRMVIMVGIPYPARNDLRVVAKQIFLDKRGTEGEGRRWYMREAIRAVNQTLGRVIRHKSDFGGVLLCDSRYAAGERLAPLASGLSSWLRPQVSVRSSFESALASCRHFFHLDEVPAAPTGSVRSGQPGAPPQVTAQTLPKGAAVATAAAAASSSGDAKAAEGGAVGTPLSALGALWKRRPAATGSSQSCGGLGPMMIAQAPCTAVALDSAPTQRRCNARPASPALAAARQPSLGIASTTAVRTPRAFIRGGRVERPGPAVEDPSGRRPVEGPGPSDRAGWLRSAEGLLPRAEHEQVREQLAVAREEADTIAAGDAKRGEERLLAAMRGAAESLLPEFCFDTPTEESLRESLVRDFGLLLPKLVRPLWKECVVELFRARGEACRIW